MTHWQDYPVPAMRHEARHGDRIVRSFHPRPASVWSMFADSVARTPDAEAVVCEALRLTYAQCDAAVARLAAGFAAQGLQAGERVVMFIDNRPEFITVWLALQRLGVITVPVGVREQRPGLAYITRQCGAAAIVADAALAERLPDATEAPDLRLRISVGDAPGCVPLAALDVDTPAPPALAPADDSDVAVILYTSGTTGNPKGAMLTHGNIVHSVLHYQACMQLQPGDRAALAVPASHVTGLVAVIASLLHPRFATARLDSLRTGGYGGAPMPVATIDALTTRLPGLALVNAYGATETTSPATMMPMGRTRDHADTVGVVLPAADIRVMDDEGIEVPIGETGELWIAGPMVVPGYWANPEATAASFTAGHWHSGDLGSVDAEGYVRVFDRKKDMLNRGGYKIFSVEVENVLMAWPGMVEAAIVGRPCPVLGERVHAFVHMSGSAPGTTPNDAALRAFCAARLADYKVPETFTWRDEPLPRNANGKLMKRLLRAELSPLPPR